MSAGAHPPPPEFLLSVIAETRPGAGRGARWRRIAGTGSIVIAPSPPQAPSWPEATPSAAPGITDSTPPASQSSTAEGTAHPYAGHSRTVTGQAVSQLHRAESQSE